MTDEQTSMLSRDIARRTAKWWVITAIVGSIVIAMTTDPFWIVAWVPGSMFAFWVGALLFSTFVGIVMGMKSEATESAAPPAEPEIVFTMGEVLRTSEQIGVYYDCPLYDWIEIQLERPNGTKETWRCNLQRAAYVDKAGNPEIVPGFILYSNGLYTKQEIPATTA